jgi:sugar phosphate isomerase/epimerase
MKLGYTPMSAQVLDIDAAFRLAHELRLDFIELSFDLHEVLPDLQAVGRVRELMRTTGIGTTVHLSYVDLNLTSLMPRARQAAIERTLAGLEYAAAVDASCGVLHAGRHYMHHPVADALAEKALAASLEALRDAPVPLALENIALDADDYVQTPHELRAWGERAHIGFCFDFGHAHIQGRREGGDAVGAYLRTLGDRVLHLHVHNNHGLRDEHLPTDQGSLDYRPYAHYLAHFPGTVCLEIEGGGVEGVRESVAHIRGILEVGE